MFERFTEAALKVIMLAQEESRHFGHDYVGTEHMLLGLMREGKGVAAKVLSKEKIGIKSLRNEIEKIVGRDNKKIGKEIPFSRDAKQALECSLEASRSLKHDYIGTEHLLLGLLLLEECSAWMAIKSLYSDSRFMRECVMELLDIDPPQELLDLDTTNRFKSLLSDKISDAQSNFRVDSRIKFRLPIIDDILSANLAIIPHPVENQVIPTVVILVCRDLNTHTALKLKLQLFLATGSQMGILLKTYDHSIDIFRHEEARTLQGEDELMLPEILNDWKISVDTLWNHFTI